MIAAHKLTTVMLGLLVIAMGLIISVPQPAHAQESRPERPTELQAEPNGPNGFTLSWHQSRTPDYHQFRFTTPDQEGYRFIRPDTHPAGLSIAVSETSATITGAQPDTAYTFQVRAVNDAGRSRWSTPVVHTTPQSQSEAAAGDTSNDTRQSPAVVITFSARIYEVTEGNSVTVTVTLDADPERTVTIPLQIGNGSAEPDQYTGVPETIVFNAGETQKTFAVHATQDDVNESRETIFLYLRPLPAGVTIGPHEQADIRIIDDDPPELEVSFDKDSYTVKEGSSVTVTIDLNMSDGSNNDAVFKFTQTNGATDADYTAIPKRMEFERGTTQLSFTFFANDDEETETDEQLRIEIDESRMLYDIGGGDPDATVITIKDQTNDSTPPTDVSTTWNDDATATIAWEYDGSGTDFELRYQTSRYPDRYFNVNGAENQLGVSASFSGNTATVTGLDVTEVMYTFDVRAKDSDGYSQWISAPQFTTTPTGPITAGTAFVADGHIFELVPHTLFIVARVHDADHYKGRGERTPAYDINFACYDRNTSHSTPTDNLSFYDDDTDGYTIRWGDGPSQTMDLVPPTPHVLPEDDYYKRRQAGTCSSDQYRNEIEVLPTAVHTRNQTQQILEYWQINDREFTLTRRPEFDTPLHVDTHQNDGFGIFSIPRINGQLADNIWVINENNLHDDAFYLHVPSQGPIGNQASPKPITQQVGDIHFSEGNAYVMELNVGTVHPFTIPNHDAPLQFTPNGDSFSVRQSSDALTRSITGYGDILFFQQQQSNEALTYQLEDEELIDSGFNYQAVGNVTGVDQLQTPWISSDDGHVLYILLTNNDIVYVTSVVTELDREILQLDENAPAGTLVKGVIRSTGQFPGSLGWNIEDLPGKDHLKCFEDPLFFGTYGQTVRFKTKETPVEGCDYDYEANELEPGVHGYEFSAQVTDSQANTEDTANIRIDLMDQDEPPLPPIINPAPSPTPTQHTNLSFSWTAPADADMVGIPPITDYETALVSDTQTCDDDAETDGSKGTQPVSDSDDTFAGLSNGTTYRFCVRSVNHEGKSAWVEQTLATTVPLTITGHNSPYSVPENQTTPFDTNIIVTDEEEDTRTLVLAGADAALFTLTNTDNQPTTSTYSIAFTDPPDYEGTPTKRTFSVTLQASSGTGNTSDNAQVAIVINLTNENDPPVGAPVITGSKQEGGILTADTSNITDDDGIRTSSWQYQWMSGTGSNVADFTNISGATGRTYTSVLADTTKNIIVRVTYRDQMGNPGNQHILYSPAVGPIVENALPEITNNPAEAAVDENHTGPVTTVTYSDANGTRDTDHVTFQLSGGADQSQFDISASGVISFKNPPNYEDREATNNDYEVEVTVTTGANHRERDSAPATFTITVNDVDEPPDTPDAGTFTNVKQLQLTFNWTAPGNRGPPITGYTIEYRLSSESDWDPANDGGNSSITSVTITGNSTRSKLITNLERFTSYTFRINATNAEGTGAWSADAPRTTNANAQPSLPSSVSRSIREDTSTGTNLGGLITATDADHSDGGEYAFTLEGINHTHFEVVKESNKARIKVAQTLDYETNPSYTLTLKVDDGQGGSATTQVSITVTDFDEPPERPAAPSVTAGSQPRTLDVSWTAPNNPGPAIRDYDVQYKVSGAASFTTHSFSGTATSTTITGLKAGTTYEVQVKAHNDEGSSSWSPSGNGTTSPNQVPTFDETIPITRQIDESVGDQEPNSRNVGAAVSATDPDGGTLTYTISGTDAGSFDINSSTGRLSTKTDRYYDHEADATYTVTIRATDSHPGEPSLYVETSVTITLQDVDEDPLKPAPPTFNGTTRFDTTVNWTAPANAARPPITKYLLQFDDKTSANGSDPLDPAVDVGTALSLEKTQLDDDTIYYARVQARNEDGNSPWSEWAQVRTVANQSPQFANNTTSRSLAENSATGTEIGNPITATDHEGDALTYSITGANPGGFTIDAADGQLAAGAIGYDYEQTTSYGVTVRVTDSPAGARTDQAVTVNISDVPEPPGKPDTPTAGDESLYSITFSWEPPDNTGPVHRQLPRPLQEDERDDMDHVEQHRRRDIEAAEQSGPEHSLRVSGACQERRGRRALVGHRNRQHHAQPSSKYQQRRPYRHLHAR